MHTVEYDEFTDDFFAKCHESDCGWESRLFMQQRDAAMAGDRHDEDHDELVDGA